MNFFDLATIIAIVVCAYHIGKYLALTYGVLGWIIGLVVGGCLPITARYLMVFLLDKCFPGLPPCKNGKCTPDNWDYKAVDPKPGDKSYIVRCKCGTKYLRSTRYFKEVLPDGSLKPYMKRNIVGGWKPDDAIE